MTWSVDGSMGSACYVVLPPDLIDAEVVAELSRTFPRVGIAGCSDPAASAAERADALVLLQPPVDAAVEASVLARDRQLSVVFRHGGGPSR